jgi:hypothetical protein
MSQTACAMESVREEAQPEQKMWARHQVVGARVSRLLPHRKTCCGPTGEREAPQPLTMLARARAQLAHPQTSRVMSSLANERTVEALRRHMPSSTGRLLEVGSGTGSNLTALALSFRDWHIQPSDIDASLLPKIATAAEQWSNVAAPVCIDAAAPADDWPVEPSFDCILAVNVCHYASPQATRGLVRPRPPFTGPHTRDG